MSGMRLSSSFKPNRSRVGSRHDAKSRWLSCRLSILFSSRDGDGMNKQIIVGSAVGLVVGTIIGIVADPMVGGNGLAMYWGAILGIPLGAVIVSAYKQQRR